MSDVEKKEQKQDGSGSFNRAEHMKKMHEKSKSSTHDFKASGQKGADIMKERKRKRLEREKKLAEAKEKMFEYLPNEFKRSIEILNKATPEAAEAMVASMRKSMEDGDVIAAAKKGEGILSLNISLADKAAKLNKSLEQWVTGEKKEVESSDEKEEEQSSAVIFNWSYQDKKSDVA